MTDQSKTYRNDGDQPLAIEYTDCTVPEYVDFDTYTTTLVGDERVVIIERPGDVIVLGRAEAYELALALLGRLGLIGFPGAEG